MNLINYHKLITILKRYSFDQKMKVCYEYSKQLITPNGIISSHKLKDNILPWELETFLLFSIKAKEWSYNNFENKNIKEFYKIIHCIREYIHPCIYNNLDVKKYMELLIISDGAVQFENQESTIYKMYRYHYYFNIVNNKINMKEKFKNKFGCYYDQFVKLGILFNLILCSNININLNKIITYMEKSYPITIKNLIITRTDYIKQLDYISTNISDYKYCFRPSYSFPFIKLESNNNIYMPLPHLFIRSITSSLLYRLTDKNKLLRDNIGKEVFEEYLFDLIYESNIFDEIHREKIYISKNGSENRTIDIMTRIGENYLFFDSKSTSPKIGIRTFNKDNIQSNIDKLAKSCVQMYKHLTYKFPYEYNFFNIQNTIDKNNVWGIVVIQQDSYILREDIYKKAAELLNISTCSDNYNWMCTHIGILELYNLERFLFVSDNILDNIKKNNFNGQINDFWLVGKTKKNIITNTKLNGFKQNSLDFVMNVLNSIK